MEDPPVRERLPRVTVPAVPLRLMNSNAPPSSWMATSEPKRLPMAWMPESSHRRRLLRMLMVSPAPMPEKRPWSTSAVMLPIRVALPVKALLSRMVSCVPPDLTKFRLPLIWPVHSRAVFTVVMNVAAVPEALLMTPPLPTVEVRASRSPKICELPLSSSVPPAVITKASSLSPVVVAFIPDVAKR